MRPVRRLARLLVAGLLCVTVSACTGGSAGDTELAFCDAVDRIDAAAAKAIFDAGQINMMARNFSGSCQPGAALLHRATPQYKEFTEMAMTFAKRDGVANTCWGTSKGQSVGGCAIQMVAQNANAAVMRALIDSGVNVTNQIARGALDDAANQGSLEIVQMLVEKGADPNSAMSPAVARRATAIIAYLESKGAHEDVAPLLVAARRGDLAAVDAALARRDDLEVTDIAGRTPLIRAALYGHAPALARLAKAGANLEATMPENYFWTAMHVAANEDHAAVVQALAAAKANVNARKDSGYQTPLMVAVGNGAINAVKALLAAGADANAWTDTETTVIRRAALLGHYANTKALLAAGARVNDAHGTGWQPPVHAVVGLCGELPPGDVENDYYRVNVLKALIAAGADGKAKNAAGQTPIEIVSTLLAGTQEPFYRACHQAKLDYLKTL